MRPWLRRAVLGVGLVVAVLAAAAAGVVYRGRAELAAGDAARAARDPDRAIVRWRAAARAYVPLAPHVAAAYERLASTARAAETAGDGEVALAAWRAIRSASRATRGITDPAGELAAEADARIAALMAADPDASLVAGDTAAAREAWQRGKLAPVPGPGVGLVALAALGIAIWIAGLCWLVRRDRGAGRRERSAAIAVAAVGAALWWIAVSVT